MAAELKTNNMAYKMKSSPAKQLWPWGKRTKTKKYEDGYEVKNVTVDRGDVNITKSDKRGVVYDPDTWEPMADDPSGVLREKSKVKTKGGEVVRSKSLVIDKGGHRKTKVKTRRGKTKKVVWEDGKRTVTRY